MPGMYADHAVMAKIRALYGGRLSTEDYNALLQKKNVGEIAAYLKQNTAYALALGEVKEELIHRGQLEYLVRKQRVDTYERLMRFCFKDRFFPILYTTYNEVQQLLAAMRMLSANTMDRFIVSFPAYLNKYLSFDLFALARIATYDDLLDVVRHSAYYHLLGPHRPPSAAAQLDILSCETTLLTYYYKTALALVDKESSARARDDLRAILRIQIDLQNLQVIYRMKRFYAASAGEIEQYLINIRTRISHSLYHRIANAEDAAAVLESLKSVRMLRRYFQDGAPQEIEYAVTSLQQRSSRRIFRFSVHPAVVQLSFMMLVQIESENLINIIEGIRYSLPADEIRALLIL